MSRRNKPTSEAELQDAINRIGKHKEAKHEARNRQSWQDYLVDTLNINPVAVTSDKGSEFWDKVRKEIKGVTEREPVRREKYEYLRDIGLSSKEARVQRDWSWQRITEYHSQGGYIVK